MSKLTSQLKIAVVIATCDRGALLANRALPSIMVQTRTPDFLIVVDDSSIKNRPKCRQIVASLNSPDVSVTYLENVRTGGASGSWNTAIDFIHRNYADLENLFIAILDDDDSWSPDYLDKCLALALIQRLDMVGADIHRFETLNNAPFLNAAPTTLSASDFLSGNPGIQGSNLFVRLSVLLAAGGFDEGLKSTTDRDLCIRIADLGTTQYGRLPEPLVQHFAETGRERLSTRGSESKVQGLTGFWQKYAGRMTALQKRNFCDRALNLFDWHPEIISSNTYAHDRPFVASSPSTPPVVLVSDKHSARHDRQITVCNIKSFQSAGAGKKIAEAPPHSPFNLYVGIISAQPFLLKQLLLDLDELRSLPSIAKLVPVVLENGDPENDVRRVIEELRNNGMEIAFISVKKQRSDAAAGAFGSQYRFRLPEQVGIAQARTMLQRYLGNLLQNDETSFAWVLDDDMRVDERAREYLPWLPAFREEGVDVLIGQYEGSSPNPPINGVRVQLVDLLHNLAWLQSLDPDGLLPDRSAENLVFRERYPDYYYDLSRKHTGHLEMPHWLEPAFKGETAGQGYSRMLAGALGLLSGTPLTRPLIAAVPRNPIAMAKDTVNRGGCTFVLNHRPLTQTPNSIMPLSGKEARRSDIMWAIVNRYCRGMTIKQVGFPICHIGRVTQTPRLNLEKVKGEIVGSAFYAGLTEFLGKEASHNLIFSRNEIERISDLVEDHLSRRLHALELSFYRIRGLTAAISRFSRHGELEELISYLHSWFTSQMYFSIRDGVRDRSQVDFKAFLSSLRGTADEFAAATVSIDFILDQILSQPVLNGELQ